MESRRPCTSNLKSDGDLEPEWHETWNDAAPANGGSVVFVLLTETLDKTRLFVPRSAEPQWTDDYRCEHDRDKRSGCEPGAEQRLGNARVGRMQNDAIEAATRERLAT